MTVTSSGVKAGYQFGKREYQLQHSKMKTNEVKDSKKIMKTK